METIDSAIKSLLKQTNSITIGSVFGVSFIIMIYPSTFSKFTSKKMKLSGSIGLRHTSFGERRVTDKIC
jgi:uncharacterized membrane protein